MQVLFGPAMAWLRVKLPENPVITKSLGQNGVRING